MDMNEANIKKRNKIIEEISTITDSDKIKKLSDELDKINIEIIRNSSLFDAKWYMNKYKLKRNEDFAKHYLYYGWEQNFNPSLFFSNDLYFYVNKDVKDAHLCPLFHYEITKNSEFRTIAPNNLFGGDYSKSLVFSDSKLRNIKMTPLLIKNKVKKILVIIHFNYMKSVFSIIKYLSNIKLYNFDLIISVPNQLYNADCIDEIRKYKKNLEVFEYDNECNNFYSFINIVKEKNIDEYDIVFNIESCLYFEKGILKNEQLYYKEELFDNVFYPLLNNIDSHKIIDALASNKYALACADNLFHIDKSFENEMFNKTLLNNNQSKVKESYHIDMGSFAIKSEYLKFLKDLKIDKNEFLIDNVKFFSQTDYINRLICNEVIENGKDFYLIKSYNKYRKKYDKIEKHLRNENAAGILNELNYSFQAEFMLNILQYHQIDHYRVEKIKLGDITRIWNGEYYKLEDCSPYLYLTGNKEKYDNYCKLHKELGFDERTIESFNNLISSIKKNGYNEKNIIVINGEDNSILDGQHRSCCLLYLYGKNKKINVLKLYFKNYDFNELVKRCADEDKKK